MLIFYTLEMLLEWTMFGIGLVVIVVGSVYLLKVAKIAWEAFHGR